MKLKIYNTRYIGPTDEIVLFTEFQYDKLILVSYKTNNIFIFKRKQNKKISLLQKILKYIF